MKHERQESTRGTQFRALSFSVHLTRLTVKARMGNRGTERRERWECWESGWE